MNRKTGLTIALIASLGLVAVSQWYHNVKDLLPLDRQTRVTSSIDTVTNEARDICKDYNGPDGSLNTAAFYGDSRFTDKVAEGRTILRLNGCEGDLYLSCKTANNFTVGGPAYFVQFPPEIDCS